MQRSDCRESCKLQSRALVLHQMICRTLSLLTCLTLAAHISHADGLPERPRTVLNQQLVPDSAVTVVVRDLASGESLVELNATMPRPPASTMKLVPTWAALELLGPAFSWKTRAWSDAPVVKGVLKGNLYLQGGGDPLLTIERWWRFVSDLRQTGLRVIEGDIVIDQTRFAALDERPEDFDGKPWRTYNVLPDALLVNLQMADFVVRPADDGKRRRSRDHAVSGGSRRGESRGPDRGSLRGPQPPDPDHESGRCPGTDPSQWPVVGQLQAADIPARSHAAGGIRLRHFRHPLARVGRRVSAAACCARPRRRRLACC